LQHSTDALGLLRSQNVTQERSHQPDFFALSFSSGGSGDIANGIELDGLNTGIAQLGFNVLRALLALHDWDAQRFD
jgi:hypothetical protein